MKDTKKLKACRYISSVILILSCLALFGDIFGSMRSGIKLPIYLYLLGVPCIALSIYGIFKVFNEVLIVVQCIIFMLLMNVQIFIYKSLMFVVVVVGFSCIYILYQNMRLLKICMLSNLVISSIGSLILNQQVTLGNGDAAIVIMTMVLNYLCSRYALKYILAENSASIAEIEEKSALVGDVLSKVTEVKNELVDTAQVLTTEFDASIVRVSTIDNGICDMTQAITEQARSVLTQSESVHGIRDESTSVIGEMERVMEVLTNISESFKNNTVDVTEMRESATWLVSDSSISLEHINTLVTDISKVQSINDVIKKISNSTNLLSLNASIEAARAGVAGKGFVVVAEEIRRLSESVKESSKTIDDVIQHTVVSSNKACELMEAIHQTTDEHLAKVNEIEKTYIETAEILHKCTEPLCRTLESIEKVVSCVNTIDIDITSISSVQEEIVASIEVIRELCTELRINSEKTKKTSESLNNTVSVLNQCLQK